MKHYILAGFVTLLPLGLHAQSAQQICQRMIDEGRAGDQTLQGCLCTHRVAEAVLDEDIQELLFDAWLTGRNNMGALEGLPNPQRVRRQFRTMEATLSANC